MHPTLRSHRPLIMGRRGAVATNHPVATQAGLDVLRAGRQCGGCDGGGLADAGRGRAAHVRPRRRRLLAGLGRGEAEQHLHQRHRRRPRRRDAGCLPRWHSRLRPAQRLHPRPGRGAGAAVPALRHAALGKAVRPRDGGGAGRLRRHPCLAPLRRRAAVPPAGREPHPVPGGRRPGAARRAGGAARARRDARGDRPRRGGWLLRGAPCAAHRRRLRRTWAG